MRRSGCIAIVARVDLPSVNPKHLAAPALRYNVYTYDGTDEPWVVASGRLQNNIFSDNTITGGTETIKLRVADGTEFLDNKFEEATTARFEDCSGTLLSGNTGLDGTKLRITDGSCFGKGSDNTYTPVC